MAGVAPPPEHRIRCQPPLTFSGGDERLIFEIDGHKKGVSLKIKQLSRRLVEALPDEVVRAKALVKLTEAPGCRWLFERTGRHPVGEPLEVSGLTKVATSVVWIGPGLDPARLREFAASHFGVTKEG